MGMVRRYGTSGARGEVENATECQRGVAGVYVCAGVTKAMMRQYCERTTSAADVKPISPSFSGDPGIKKY